MKKLNVLMCGGRRISDAVLSIHRGFEKLGHDVQHVATRKAGTKYEPADDLHETLSGIVRDWKPDLLIWVMCKYDCPPGLISELRRLRPEMATVFHSFDDPVQIDLTGAPWAMEFSHVVTCCIASVPWYEQHGLQAICLYPPSDAEIHGNATAIAQEECELSLAATNVYPRALFPHVLAERTELARLADRLGHLNLYGPWEGSRVTWGGQFGAPDLKHAFKGRRNWDQMPGIYKSAKINLNSHNRPDAYGYLNERTIHVLSTGSFMLTDAVAGIETLFDVGRHLDTWSSLEEAEDKMLFWLRHDTARQKVAQEAKAFTLDHYSNTAHNQKLIDFLRLS